MNAYVIVDSPIGRLLLQTDGASLTGLYMDVPGRPFPGMNDSEENANAGPLPEAVLNFSSAYGVRSRKFRMGKPGATVNWRSASAIRMLRGRWGSRTAATPSPSWFRAIGSSVRTDR